MQVRIHHFKHALEVAPLRQQLLSIPRAEVKALYAGIGIIVLALVLTLSTQWLDQRSVTQLTPRSSRMVLGHSACWAPEKIVSQPVQPHQPTVQLN